MAETNKENTVNILETFFNKGEKIEPKFKSLEELAISVANKFKNNRKGGGDSSEIEYVTHKCIIFDNYQQYKEFKKTDKTGCNGWSKEFKELIDCYNQSVIESLGLNNQNIYSVDDLIQYFKSMYPSMKESFGVDSLDLFIDMCFVMILEEGSGAPITQIDKWNTNCWNCIGGIVNIETGTSEDDGGNGRSLGEGTVTGIVTTNSNNCEFTYDMNKKLNDWMNGGYISLLAQTTGKTEDEVLAMIDQMGGVDENQIKLTFVMPLIADMGDPSVPGSHKLINCLNCLNCLKCQECINCKNCEECNSSNDILTSNCEGCKQCNGCKNCINCVVCTECNKCLNCYNDCYGCTECNNCNYCDNCNSCINCEQCENCVRCSGCISCNNSEECIKCESCNTCYDCRECEELENVQCRYKTWYKKDYYKK